MFGKQNKSKKLFWLAIAALGAGLGVGVIAQSTVGKGTYKRVGDFVGNTTLLSACELACIDTLEVVPGSNTATIKGDKASNSTVANCVCKSFQVTVTANGVSASNIQLVEGGPTWTVSGNYTAPSGSTATTSTSSSNSTTSTSTSAAAGGGSGAASSSAGGAGGGSSPTPSGGVGGNGIDTSTSATPTSTGGSRRRVRRELFARQASTPATIVLKLGTGANTVQGTYERTSTDTPGLDSGASSLGHSLAAMFAAVLAVLAGVFAF